MPPNIISNQADLLRALKDGGKFSRRFNDNTRKTEWWISNAKHRTRVLFSTANAAREKGYIDQVGDYWKLTDAAQLHIRHETRRSMLCATCDHQRRQHSRYRCLKCLATLTQFPTRRCTCTGFKEHTP